MARGMKVRTRTAAFPKSKAMTMSSAPTNNVAAGARPKAVVGSETTAQGNPSERSHGNPTNRGASHHLLNQLGYRQQEDYTQQAPDDRPRKISGTQIRACESSHESCDHQRGHGPNLKPVPHNAPH